MGCFDDLAIGVTRRGRVAAIKSGGKSGSHCLIVGATGAGKSTVLGALAFEYAWRGHGVVLVEAKRDPQLEEQARRAAARWGRAFVMVSPEGPTVWDALASGGVDETVAKLLACEEWSEPFYKAEATRFLRWVVRAIEGCETPLTLAQVLELCDPDRLARTYGKARRSGTERGDQSARRSLTQPERRDVAGLRSRLAVLAESEFGRRWLDPASEAGPVLDLAEAIRRRAVVYFRLDAERLGVVAEKVGAAVAIELGAIASGLQGAPIPTFVGIDELGAIESDHSASSVHSGAGRRLLGRGRDAHARRPARLGRGIRGAGRRNDRQPHSLSGLARMTPTRSLASRDRLAAGTTPSRPRGSSGLRMGRERGAGAIGCASILQSCRTCGAASAR